MSHNVFVDRYDGSTFKTGKCSLGVVHCIQNFWYPGATFLPMHIFTAEVKHRSADKFHRELVSPQCKVEYLAHTWCIADDSLGVNQSWRLDKWTSRWKPSSREIAQPTNPQVIINGARLALVPTLKALCLAGWVCKGECRPREELWQVYNENTISG